MLTKLAGSLAGQIRAFTDEGPRRISSHDSRLVMARLRTGQPANVEDGLLDAQR